MEMIRGKLSLWSLGLLNGARPMRLRVAITPAEAAELGKLIDVHARAIETVDLETHIAKLEGANEGNNQ
jgi:hypothetical protein